MTVVYSRCTCDTVYSLKLYSRARRTLGRHWVGGQRMEFPRLDYKGSRSLLGDWSIQSPPHGPANPLTNATRALRARNLSNSKRRLILVAQPLKACQLRFLPPKRTFCTSSQDMVSRTLQYLFMYEGLGNTDRQRTYRPLARFVSLFFSFQEIGINVHNVDWKLSRCKSKFQCTSHIAIAGCISSFSGFSPVCTISVLLAHRLF